MPLRYAHRGEKGTPIFFPLYLNLSATIVIPQRIV